MKRLSRWSSAVILLLANQKSAAALCTSSHLAVPPLVEDTAGALQLAEALNCSIGSFDVEWVGRVVVEETILVSEGTSLMISGANDSTSYVNGAGKTTLFEVNGGTLSLYRLALINGAGNRGGAIYATDSVITATRCTISNNTAEYGGATFLEGSVFAFTHSSLTGNTAYGDGGAMYSGSSNVTLAGNVRFESNTASSGGALYLVDSSIATVTGNSVSFAWNTAAAYGGGFCAERSTVKVSGNAEFVGNIAEFGGATYTYSCSLFFDGDGRFVNNLASDSGGAVSSDYSHIGIAGTVVWENNSALVTGGSLIMYETSVHVQAFGKAAFVGNTAAFEGSAYMSNSVLVVDGNIIFTNNTGGALYSDLSVINISGDARWETNQSPEGDGGLLTWKTATHVQLSGITGFVGNTAAYGGAAFLSSSSLVVDGDIFFTNNSGGALYSDLSFIDISGNALWKRNESPDGGGGLVMEKTYTIVQPSGTISFDGNIANFGGALHMYNSTILAYGDVIFAGNIADGSGGGFHAEQSSISMMGGAVWSGNLASVSGGGLTMWETTLRVHSTGKSEFIANAAMYGGASDINNCTLFIDGEVLFVDNVANHSGGAVDIDDSIFDVSGRILFDKNIATEDGGGIASSRSNTTIQHTGTAEFYGNSATSAGAIYIDNDTLSVHGRVIFADNFASYRGGAVNSDHSFFTVTATGTAVWENNTSSNQGGGLAMWVSTAEFQAGSNASFSCNSARVGGGMSLDAFAVVSFAGLATFVNNSAESGAGMKMTQFSSAIFEGDVTMLGNKASSNGGAMHCESPTMLTLDGVRFVSNYASVNGGVMFALLVGTERTAETEAEPAVISNCWFSDNNSEGAGGAIFVAGGFIMVVDTQFYGNTAGEVLQVH